MRKRSLLVWLSKICSNVWTKVLYKYMLNAVDTVFCLTQSGVVLHVDQHEMEVSAAVDTHKSVFGVCRKSAATPHFQLWKLQKKIYKRVRKGHKHQNNRINKGNIFFPSWMIPSSPFLQNNVSHSKENLGYIRGWIIWEVFTSCEWRKPTSYGQPIREQKRELWKYWERKQPVRDTEFRKNAQCVGMCDRSVCVTLNKTCEWWW